MSLMEDGHWQELYVSVMSERDENERRRKAQMAEIAMRRRTNALKRRRDTESILEVQAITAALEKLASLRPQESETQALKMETQSTTNRGRATE